MSTTVAVAKADLNPTAGETLGMCPAPGVDAVCWPMDSAEFHGRQDRQGVTTEMTLCCERRLREAGYTRVCVAYLASGWPNLSFDQVRIIVDEDDVPAQTLIDAINDTPESEVISITPAPGGDGCHVIQSGGSETLELTLHGPPGKVVRARFDHGTMAFPISGREWTLDPGGQAQVTIGPFPNPICTAHCRPVCVRFEPEEENWASWYDNTNQCCPAVLKLQINP